jgi:hypothetical protein
MTGVFFILNNEKVERSCIAAQKALLVSVSAFTAL